jgi:HTH-type transcriptional regulator / antitoxin HigA
MAMAEIETYLTKGFDDLSEKEDAELERLSKMVSRYELIHFPMPVKHDLTVILEAYMREHHLTKQRLAMFLGVGNSTLSEVMNKKRPMTLDLAKRLHTKMNLDGNLILEMA